MKYSYLPYLFLCLAFAIIVIPLIFYVCHFGEFGLSDEPAIWGAFGDYLNVWISCASLILLSGLTFYLSNIDNKRQEEYQRLEASRNKPFLTCKLDKNATWKIRNVGNGPAINIRYSFVNATEQFDVPTKIHSLISGEDFLFQFGEPNTVEFKLAIAYYDIHNNVISTFFEKDDSQIFEGIDLLKDFDKGNYVSLYMLEKIMMSYR